MTRRASSSQIDIKQALAATDLVALISADLALKKTGAEFNACCPFHDEKTPSFTVSPSKQFFHCFGCGMHGDALTWLTEYRGLPFRAALESLASAAGIAVQPTDGGEQRARQTQRVLSDIEAALVLELQVLLLAVEARVTARAMPASLRERYPHIKYGVCAVPDAPWEREYLAAGRILKALDALYGVGE